MSSRGFWRKAALAAVLATVVGGAAAGPALADNDDWRGDRWRHEERWREHRREEWREREWREREWREHHRTVYAPGYAYEAPAPYYYAPPPVPPGINFVFPLNIR